MTLTNEYRQVTDVDFKAPEGKFRIMREEMSDGLLSIVADFDNRRLAEIAWKVYSTDHNFSKDVFTLCDENGPVEV